MVKDFYAAIGGIKMSRRHHSCRVAISFREVDVTNLWAPLLDCDPPAYRPISSAGIA